MTEASEPECKKQKLDGTVGTDSGPLNWVADYPVLAGSESDEDSVVPLKADDWDSPGAELSRSELARRRLRGLEALHKIYRQQLKGTTAAAHALQAEYTHVDAPPDAAMEDATALEGMAAPLCFSDVEDQLAAKKASDSHRHAASACELLQARQSFAAALTHVERLERLASASSARELASKGATAALVGRRGRYLIRSTCVTVGRGPKQVDVDLSSEAKPHALKSISQRQATLELQQDGMWRLTNIGRGSVAVNACRVAPGNVAAAPHLSMLEFGSTRLLLITNSVSVCRGQSAPRRSWRAVA
mmetsp:Transcript_12039/g.33856  ORF Transcript_12039/g.33856 Transcript_12039/m.33856 type:complete len:303 (-) Transcript_12039:309-1217(-)